MENYENRINSLSDAQKLIFEHQLKLLRKKYTLKNESPVKHQIVAYVKGNIEALELKTYLKDTLPEYMIPAKFHILDSFPRLPNGKIDQNALNSLSHESNLNLKVNLSTLSKLEIELIKIWEEVLNYSPIGINDNFFEYGGDSMLSIQIIAKARKKGIHIEANQIFDHQTIQELANNIQYDENFLSLNKSPFSGVVHLSPFQHWTLEKEMDLEQFKIGYVFELPTKIEPEELKTALESILSRHESLRLSFHKKKEAWTSLILPIEEIDYYKQEKINSEYFDNPQKMSAVISSYFNPNKKGSFNAVHLTSEDKNYEKIILILNSLSVDMHSIKEIQKEIMTNTQNLKLEEHQNFELESIPYTKWIEKLLQSSETATVLNQFPFWQKQQQFLQNTGNQIEEHQNIKTIHNLLDVESSHFLIHEATVPYNTSVNELILYAFIDSLSVWSNQEIIHFFMKCSFRSESDEYQRNDKTIGNFNSFFPLTIKHENYDFASAIKYIKETIRPVLSKGTAFSILKYYTKNNTLFNTNISKVDYTFCGLESNIDWENDFDGVFAGNIGTLIKGNKIGLSLAYYSRKIHFYWKYDSELFTEEEINNLTEHFNQCIRLIITKSGQTNDINYSPSDFPDSGLDEDELNNLLDSFN